MLTQSQDTIGERIRKLRIRYKNEYKIKHGAKKTNPYNLPIFAKKAGITPSALSQIERNIIKNPTKDVIKRICSVFNIPYDKIMKDNNESLLINNSLKKIYIKLEKVYNKLDKISIQNNLISDIEHLLEEYEKSDFDISSSNEDNNFEEWM